MSNPFRKVTLDGKEQTRFANLEQSGDRTLLGKGEFQSPNYTTGQRGWKVDSEGKAEFTDLQVSGFVKTVSIGQSIQSAIDFLNTHGGGEVRLDAGTHTLTGDITIYSGVSLVGAGRDSTILEFSGSANGILAIGTASAIKKNFKLANFTLQNSNNPAGIDVDYCDFWRTEDIRVTSCDQVGIRISRSKNFRIAYSVSDANVGDNWNFNCDVSPTRAITDFTLLGCDGSDGNAKGFVTTAGADGMDNGVFLLCNADDCGDDEFELNVDAITTFIGCTSNGVIDLNATYHTFIGCGGEIQTDNSITGGQIIGQGSDLQLSDLRNAQGAAFNAIANNYQYYTSRKEYVISTNNSGGALVAGDVVIYDPTDPAININTTTTVGSSKVFGVLSANVIASGTANVIIYGYTTTLKVNGTTDIAVGDYLCTFSSAGISQKATTTGQMVFAIALEAYTTDDSNGVIDAYILPWRFPLP